jgi:hypothetical protein
LSLTKEDKKLFDGKQRNSVGLLYKLLDLQPQRHGVELYKGIEAKTSTIFV